MSGYQFPAAVQRQTTDQIELFILNRETEELAVQPATYLPGQTGWMAAYRMRWLRSGRNFAVTTHPDGHATDSRFPGRALDLRDQARPVEQAPVVTARDIRANPGTTELWWGES